MNDEARSILKGRARRRSFQVMTIGSNKGGVGKTTISSNLAVYFRALREDLPILMLSLDDQSLLDRMFCLDDDTPQETVATGFESGTFEHVIRLGQYGVHYVPSAPNNCELKQAIRDPLCLLETLHRTQWNGLVIIDTKSDLDMLTRNAVAASDLVLVPVKNDTSLREASKLFQLFDEWSLEWDRARILLSMINRRIKYREGENLDVLSLLVSRIRDLGYPLLESFISESPKVESISSNPSGRVFSILQHARSSVAFRQMLHVAEDVLKLLDAQQAVPNSALGS
jgi:cellulose biosynthesis protein BcsQ